MGAGADRTKPSYAKPTMADQDHSSGVARAEETLHHGHVRRCHSPYSEGVGERIHVTGRTCSSKSTLAQRLARHLDILFVELEAVNWQPEWVGLNSRNPQELARRIEQATKGDAWVVAGSNSTFS